MRKEDEDEIWESDAQVTFSSAAESEFARLKYQLKVKAGLIKQPLYLRVYKQIKDKLKRLLSSFAHRN